MTDTVIDDLIRANPLPIDGVGALEQDGTRQLLAAITAPERPRRTSARRLAIAALAAICISAPLAFAAKQTQLFDFAFGDSVPRSVSQGFENALPPPHGPKEGPKEGWDRSLLIRSSERLVDRTTTSSGKVARMYAVDLRHGGTCFLAVGGPFNGGGCGKPSQTPAGRIPFVGSVGTGGSHPSGTFATGAVFFGRVTSKRVAQLLVHYADGATDEIGLDDGWFMYEVPAAHERLGHEPARIDALDDAGKTVGSEHDPFRVHPPKTPPVERPVSPRVVERVPLHWHGGFLELQEARGDQGNRCVRVLNTIDLIQTRSWTCGAFVGRSSDTRVRPPQPSQPVEWGVGRRTKDGKPDGYVYLHGWAGPAIASVELRFQDSTVQRLALRDRLFLYVVPREHWVLGARPSYLVARDRAGRPVFRRFLYPAARCTYPDRDVRCRGIIYSGG